MELRFTPCWASSVAKLGLLLAVAACCVVASGDVASASGRSEPQIVGGGRGKVQKLSPVSSVSAGSGHTCAVLISGVAKCWGDGQAGQLGSGSRASQTKPGQQIVFGIGQKVSSISSGTSHTCAVMRSGEATCWGDSALGTGTVSVALSPPAAPINFGRGVKADTIEASHSFSCAMLSDDTARCFGAGQSGQLGDGRAASTTTPAAAINFGPGLKPRSISTGDAHACALLSDGTVQCWGSNQFGQIGDGTNVNRPTPRQVDFGSGVTATSISVGSFHSCAYLSTQEISCWGLSAYGQLGDGTFSLSGHSTPTRVQLDPSRKVRGVEAGGLFTCALVKLGSTCWGSNLYGELGIDLGATMISKPTNQVIRFGRDIAQLSLGAGHQCAVLSNATVRCLGRNFRGALGDGTLRDRWQPGGPVVL